MTLAIFKLVIGINVAMLSFIGLTMFYDYLTKEDKDVE